MDEVMDKLISTSPQISTEAVDEIKTRRKALQETIGDLVPSSLPSGCVNRLQNVVEFTRGNMLGLGRALVGESPADVESMQLTLKPGAQAVRSKLRVHLSQRVRWLADHTARLEAAGMGYHNN